MVVDKKGDSDVHSDHALGLTLGNPNTNPDSDPNNNDDEYWEALDIQALDKL